MSIVLGHFLDFVLPSLSKHFIIDLALYGNSFVFRTKEKADL